MDLQPLFDEPILAQEYLDPGYSGHASDVWRVRTASGVVVVRAYRWGGPGGPFWGGLHQLFGIDPSQVWDLDPLNARLTSLSPVPAPRVLRKGVLEGRQFVIVEHMPGGPLDDFKTQPDGLLEELGYTLARLHSHSSPYYGHPAGHVRHPVSSWGTRLAETMRTLVQTLDVYDQRVEDMLEPICLAAQQIVLTEPVLVMPDIDPRQFLADGTRLTAIVDTEAYVVGPREIDLLALEYVLDQRTAAAFSRGYQAVQPLPDLEPVRTVYRYLLRLLEVQGAVDLDEWMNWPRFLSSS